MIEDSQVHRIEIGGVIFYAGPEIAERIKGLVEATRKECIKDLPGECWPEIAAELLLERLKNGHSGPRIDHEDVDYLAAFLAERNIHPISKPTHGTLALTNPLTLVSTFLL